MIEYSEHPERLYLSKSETGEFDVFVDTICLPQHQYDGIRFIYKHFKKGKPGVIINDPSGYGKRVQAVLFLTALRYAMTPPILILCPDSKIQIWTELFNKWSKLGSDVTVQKGYDLVKPVCVISTYYYISTLSHHDWGVVLVDDNVVSRDVLRSGLKVTYKIWLTDMDMMKNLQTFSLIYKWFYPNKRFPIENFQTTKRTPSALFALTARLDAFMEDIVLRRKGVMLPFGKPNPALNTSSAHQKNKDATGKKVKRSKPQPEHKEEGPKSKEKVVEKVSVRLCNNGEIENKSNNIDDFEVNINDKEQAKMDVDFTLPDVASNHNNEIEGLINKLDDKDNEQEESKMEMEFTGAGHTKKIHLAVECTQVDANTSLNDEDMHSQNITIKYDGDTPDIDDDITPSKTTKYTHDTNCENNQAESKDLFSTDTLQSQHESKADNNEILFNDNASITTVNETDHKNNEIHSEDVFSTHLQINEVKNEIKTADLNHNDNELVNKSNLSEINKTDPKLDGIELKIKQMEELAMEKFKGSFLDKMF